MKREYLDCIIVGFLVGIGFNFADQLIWLLFDLLKESHNIPLG